MYIASVKKKAIKIISFCVLCALFCLGVYKAINTIFSINVIEVVGSGVAVQIDEKKIIKTLLFFPSDHLRQEILRDNLYLADVIFKKVYPHTLKIIPVLRTPFARLNSNGRMVLVDKEGIVLSDGDQGLQLPLIICALPFIRVGEEITDERVKTALSAIEILSKEMQVVSVTEADGSSLLIKTTKLDIFIPHNSDIKQILTTLQTLLAGFRIKGTLPAVVDLRFDKPIIKF